MLIPGKRFLAARAALVYITLGALTEIWSGVWYWYLARHDNPPATDFTWLLCHGFLLTGLALLVIGLMIAWTSRLTASEGSQTLVEPPVASPVLPNGTTESPPEAIGASNLVRKEASYGTR